MSSPLVIPGKDRKVEDEMVTLMAFAMGHPDLAFMRRAMLDASLTAMKEKRYSSDGFERGWKMWYDDAAKLFKKERGWTPLAKARQMAAATEAHAARYSLEKT